MRGRRPEHRHQHGGEPLLIRPRSDSAARRGSVKPGVRRFYDALARRDADFAFLDYGYAPGAAGQGPAGELAEGLDGELETYAVELYRRTLAGLDPTGARVVELGCGRGGGARFLFAEHPPRRYLGLDLSPQSVRLCRRRLDHVPRAAFVAGDAEAPPLGDGGWDVVLSVEAFHHFERPDRFFAAAWRALGRGGSLLLAGLVADSAAATAGLSAAGFRVAEQEDLTAGVVRSLRRTSARRRQRVEALPLPARFRPFLLSWAGVVGHPVLDRLEDGGLRYVRWHARRS